MLPVAKLRDRLSRKQKNFIKKAVGVFVSPFTRSSNLKMLALKHGSDKGLHGYIESYEQHFDPLRKKRLNLLEIGIGGYEDPKSGGASVRMWQGYFPNSMIYGIDIEDKRAHEDKRIKIFQGSQNDPRFLEKVVKEIGRIDIIIDDGSHLNEHVITSFKTLFPCLADGGIYVIEDTHTAYWPEFGGNSEDLNDPKTSMSLFKSLVDGLNYKHIRDRSPTYFDENIRAIHFYPKAVFLVKGKNLQSSWS